MLARLDGDQVLLLTVIFVFVAVVTVVQQRAKERRDRLRLLENALKGDQLDPQSRQELLRTLAGGSAAGEAGSNRMSRALFATGWLGLCVGIAMIAMGHRDTYEAGIFIAACSFGLISLPLAIREFERDRSRRQA